MKADRKPRKPKQSPSRSANEARESKPQPANSEIVLLAVTGMSPAVLTETIWALAHPVGNTAPVIPDKVVVLTTGTGQSCIQRELFTPLPEFGGAAVWDALRALVLQGQHQSDPRLLLDAIRTITISDVKS